MVAPLLLGVTGHLKERSPLAAMLIDRLGAVTTRFELRSLTRGRVMRYAFPDHLKDEYGVDRPKSGRWTPPPVSALLADQRDRTDRDDHVEPPGHLGVSARAPDETSMNS